MNKKSYFLFQKILFSVSVLFILFSLFFLIVDFDSGTTNVPTQNAIQIEDKEGKIVIRENLSDGDCDHVIKHFDDKGKVIEEYYYDKSDNIVVRKEGNSGFIYEYDDCGNQVLITYVDEHGYAMTNKSGYSSLYRTYDDNGSVRKEFYLDINGDQVAINGSFGLMYIGNKRFSMNEDGSIRLSLSKLIENYPWVLVISGIIIVIVAIYLPENHKIVFIIFYLAFIIMETIASRKSGGKLMLSPFWSYKSFFSSFTLRLEILENIWLFVPFGAGVYTLLQNRQFIFKPKLFKVKATIGVSFLFSTLIELSQYIFRLGLFELDDIISNTMGATFGIIIVLSIQTVKSSVNMDK